MILTQPRRDAYLPLALTPAPDELQEKLARLGINTLEELRDYWTYGNRQLLTDYLGESPVRFIAAPPPAGATRGAAAAGPGGSVNVLGAGPVPPLVRHPRGVLLPQRRPRAETPRPLPARRAQAPSQTGVSLVDRFPAVRDQGQRGTCVAFASVAYLEYHLSAGAQKVGPLSEQFVYWACKENDGLASIEGTHVRVGADVLRKRGVCRRKTWKYSPVPSATEGQGPPPDGAEEEARGHRWPDARKLDAGDVRKLRTCIDRQQPVVLSVYTFSNWDFPVVAETGEVAMPLPSASTDGAHAVCLVGYELNDRLPGGGAFIFRNSWGKSWARRRGRFGDGYGTLLFEYVRLYGMEAFR